MTAPAAAKGAASFIVMPSRSVQTYRTTPASTSPTTSLPAASMTCDKAVGYIFRRPS